MNLGALGTHASGKGGSDFCALLLKSRCASHHPSRRPHRWSRDLGLRLGPAGGFLRTSRRGPELPRSSRRFKRLSESLFLHSQSEVRARRTELRIFRGNGIPMDEVSRFVGGLKRYYDYYGVTMFTRYDVISVPLDHAIVLNEQAITDWMRTNTSVDPTCAASAYPTTACDQAMGAAMFYNVKEFFHAYSEPEQNVINVVLLKRIAALDPRPDASETAWGVAGLGLSQALVNSTSGSDLGSTSLADILNETSFRSEEHTS